jgi:hypothetical protein
MYAAQGAAAGSSEGPGASADADDDVVDAEIVDEDSQK